MSCKTKIRRQMKWLTNTTKSHIPKSSAIHSKISIINRPNIPNLWFNKADTDHYLVPTPTYLLPVATAHHLPIWRIVSSSSQLTAHPHIQAARNMKRIHRRSCKRLRLIRISTTVMVQNIQGGFKSKKKCINIFL